MKSVIALALLIVSISAQANVLGSVDSFLSIVPLGTHQGKDDAGTACSVTVNEVNFPAKAIAVTVAKKGSKIFKLINDGSEFRFVAFKNEFIQSDRYYIDDTRISYVERTVRTVKAGDNLQYVVVANEIVVNRDRSVEEIDCVVRL